MSTKATATAPSPAKAPAKTPLKAPRTPAKRPVKAASPAAKSASVKSPAPPKPVTQNPVVKATALPPSAAPAKSAKPAKDKKVKVIRDSFSIPKAELLQVNEMKKRAMTLGVSVKKSELLRAGLLALSSMADPAFKKALASVPTIKTGRPAKD